MPPRVSYWTIIAGGLPTAFRAAEREELLPTFTRLKAKQPDAEMKWFARGKLWASPEEAREQLDRRRNPGQQSRRDTRAGRAEGDSGDRPDRDQERAGSRPPDDNRSRESRG